MTSTPPPHFNYAIPPIPRLPSPSSSRHPRASINSSFSFGPESLVSSFLDGNTSGSHHYPFNLDPNRSILPSSPLRSSPRRPQRPRDRHPLAKENTDVFHDSGDEDDDDSEWGIVDRMRLWRHDALMQHLYETASFWGDKVVSWTNDPNDAFWLAQTYFMTHQYSRAERLLTRPFPLKPSGHHTQSVANGYASDSPTEVRTGVPFPDQKGKGREEPRLPVGPTAMIEVAAEHQEGISRLVDMSVVCRYLAAQCLVRQGKWAEATEMLGEANPFRNSGRSGPGVANEDGGIKVEASMCNLRGILMLKLNRGDQAKACFMEALTLDVKCYDAFDQLISGEMMTVDEEWEFVQGLAYQEQTRQDAEFVRLIYTARLRKYKHAEEHALARRRLAEEFGLSDNPDVLFSFADALYAQFRWADCFTITSRILGLVAVHAPTMPLHIACMHHLKHLHSRLFVLAHELVEREPESPMSWYAVGVWYLTQQKWADARTYFSKTSLMDPRFGPAWIAFAHTFAFEGEHDHAITAYSTCARMFTGSHLPLMFVGMEHIILSNPQPAMEALNASLSMCDSDPLLMNEIGVMAFYVQEYKDAANMFSRALELAQVTQTSQSSWATTFLNLGTCYRKLGNLAEAERTYIRVLEIDNRSAPALGFLGLVYHLMGRIDDAIVRYHEALAVNPLNMHLLDLLNLALESVVDIGLFGKTSDAAWAERMRENGRREAAGNKVRERAIAENKAGGKGLFYGMPPGPDLWETKRKQLEETLPGTGLHGIH
ncbi:TPR-like protein [Vararia minispora EC-137]|uniref:TPR-like protein n=1 Tax=Vararia minispora EC-137 TaxID=1314806 RepID=A0ACB8QRC8_9AGAM|nr:TPR-like protein [Vararia minispora EC-137]